MPDFRECGSTIYPVPVLRARQNQLWQIVVPNSVVGLNPFDDKETRPPAHLSNIGAGGRT
jgi:hypothetical protein